MSTSNFNITGAPHLLSFLCNQIATNIIAALLLLLQIIAPLLFQKIGAEHPNICSTGIRV